MDNKKFGAFIAAQRKAKGLTQKELANDYVSLTKRFPNGSEGFHLDKDTTPFPR